MKTIEELLQTPYRIIDILPQQVLKDSPGQYFRIERDWFRDRTEEIKQKHISVILKLNCYMDISLDDEPEVNPEPVRIAEIMKTRYVCIRTGGAVIVSDPADTHMTVYNADEALLDLIRKLAAGEGLFVRKPVFPR